MCIYFFKLSLRLTSNFDVRFAYAKRNLTILLTWLITARLHNGERVVSTLSDFNLVNFNYSVQQTRDVSFRISIISFA